MILLLSTNHLRELRRICIFCWVENIFSISLTDRFLTFRRKTTEMFKIFSSLVNCFTNYPTKCIAWHVFLRIAYFRIPTSFRCFKCRWLLVGAWIAENCNSCDSFIIIPISNEIYLVNRKYKHKSFQIFYLN